MTRKTNPYFPQDRVRDMLEIFEKHGYILYPQQKKMYEAVAWILGRWENIGKSVLEVGCGNGVGSVLIERAVSKFKDTPFKATDVSSKNIAFASHLYPWITFAIWDIRTPSILPQFDYTVAIEVFEHIEEPEKVMKNLLDTCRIGLFLSTPNGTNKPHPPENPHHVDEYTPKEMFEFATKAGAKGTQVYNWETGKLDDVSNPKNDPILYYFLK